MKNLDLNSYGVQEMDANEIKNLDGGFSIIKITGVLDGIKHNTEVYVFGFRVV